MQRYTGIYDTLLVGSYGLAKELIKAWQFLVILYVNIYNKHLWKGQIHKLLIGLQLTRRKVHLLHASKSHQRVLILLDF